MLLKRRIQLIIILAFLHEFDFRLGMVEKIARFQPCIKSTLFQWYKSVFHHTLFQITYVDDCGGWLIINVIDGYLPNASVFTE